MAGIGTDTRAVAIHLPRIVPFSLAAGGDFDASDVTSSARRGIVISGITAQLRHEIAAARSAIADSYFRLWGGRTHLQGETRERGEDKDRDHEPVVQLRLVDPADRAGAEVRVGDDAA